MAAEEWDVEKWLKTIRLSKYKQAFRDNGYETVDLCANLSIEDLDAMGISNKQHRSTLFAQAEKLKETLGEVVDDAEDAQPLDKLETPVKSHARCSSEERSEIPKGNNGHSLGRALSMNQSDLAQYSEPWSGISIQPNKTSTDKVKPVTKMSKSGSVDKKSKSKSVAKASKSRPAMRKPITAQNNNTTDGPSPSHKQTTPKKNPSSPGGTDFNVKRDSTSGMTRLQLKLKIREELFSRNVVLSESPYCKQVMKWGGIWSAHLCLIVQCVCVCVCMHACVRAWCDCDSV